MKVGTVSKVMLGGNADVSTKSGIIIDADVILGKAEGRTKDLKGLVLSNKVMFGKSVSRAVLATVSGVPPLVLPNAVGGNVMSLKAFGGIERRPLVPTGYTQVEYVDIPASGYLTTDVVATYDGKYEFDFQTTTLGASGATTYLGVRPSTSGNGGLRVARISSQVFRIYGFGAYKDSTDTAIANTRYKFVWDNQHGVLTTGSTTVFDETFTGTSDNTYPITINGWNTAGTVTPGSEEILVYGFKAWDNQGTLVANYIPAIEDSTSKVGFYDLVTASFKEATAGTFTAGPVAAVDLVSNNGVLSYVDAELPTGYRRLQDIIYNNDCYYTITGLRPTGADTLKFSFKCTQAQPACNIAGCYTTSSAQDNLSLYVGYTQSTAKYLRYDGGTYSSWVVADKRYDVQITPTGSIGMEQEETWEQKTFTCSVDFNIGTTSTGATSSKLVGVLYGNIEVVGRAKLIPCKRVSDGYIGYYDTYTNTFYEKAWGTEPTTSGYDYSHYVLVAGGPIETIQTTGNNIFNKNDLTRIYAYISASGASWAYVASGYSVRIPCMPNTTYTARYNGSSSQTVLSFGSTSSDNIPVRGSSVSMTNSIRQNSPTINTPITITTGASDKWLIVAYNASEPENTDMANNLQIEIGPTATGYQPYYSATATCEYLLSVGDYQDEQEVIGGTVTRRVGVKVLDGTESFSSGQASGVQCISIPKTAWGISSDTLPENSLDVICTHYKCVNGANWAQSKLNTIKVGSGYLFFNTEYVQNSTSFKAYLANQYAAGTPVIVVYPLATATTETVTSQPMTTTQGTNIAEITQASLDGLELSVTYMAGVDATVTEIENAQLSPDVDVTIS